MSGRGRGRPPSRSAQDPAAGPSRRSTRHQQQQHQDAAEPGDAVDAQAQLDPHAQLNEQQQQEDPQEQQEQTISGLQAQPEAPMAAPDYHQIIDPAITGPHDGVMPPPPVPSSKSLRGQAGPHIARRGTRRDARASSIASIHSVPVTDAFSSQPEPQGIASQSQMGTPAAARAVSISSSAATDTPSRKAAKAKLMNVMLERFFNASEDLFNHLCTNSADPEMWDIELGGYKKALDTYRSYYIADIADPAVDPSFVADTMGIDRASPVWQKVVRIVLAGNITSFLDDVRTIHQQPDPLPLLQEWDSTFAGFFDYGDPDVSLGARMKDLAIEHALTVRTLLSIFTLEKLQRDSPTLFQPLPQLFRIWCDGDMSIEDVQAAVDHNRAALPLRPLAPSDFGSAAFARDRSEYRFGGLWNDLQKVAGESHIDFHNLYATYATVDEFQDNVRDFVQRSFDRLKVSLQQGPSVGRDSALALAPSDGASRADSQIRSQLETEAVAHGFGGAEVGAPSVSYNMDSLRMMKQLEQQGAAMYGDGHQLPGSTYSPAPRIPYPPGFTSPPPSLSYTDPSQQGGFQPNGSIYAESAAQVSGRKRGAQGEPTAAGEGAAAPATPGAKKRRTRRKKNEVSEAGTAPPATAAPASAPQPPPMPLSQYPPLPGTQDDPDFEALSQRTKEISAAARKVKEPQVRSAWVRKDVALLVKAVNTYQCKWSTIEKEIKAGTIEFERPRDQQALRDKARLLKQDFLKADAVLPRGFDLVVLGKKEREAVKAVGKNPDRREADIDANGRPINTEYAPPELVAAPAPLPAPVPPVEPHLEQLSQPQPQHQQQQLPQPEPQPAVPEGLAA